MVFTRLRNTVPSIAPVLAWLCIILASLKVSYLPSYLGLIHFNDEHPVLSLWSYVQLFIFNGLPLILVWYLLSHVFHRGVSLLIILLFVDIFCFASTSKVRTLVSPLIFSDIFELPTVLNVRSSSAMYMNYFDYLSFLDLLVPVVFWGGLGRKKIRHDRLGMASLASAALVLFLVSCAVVLGGNSLYVGERAEYEWYGTAALDDFRIKGPLNTFAASGMEYFKVRHRKKPPDKEEVSKAISYIAATRETAPSLTLSAGGRRPNVIIILEESMGRSGLEAPVLLENNRDATPFVNSLRDELVFTKSAFSPVVAGMTAEAEFTVLNSLYPETQTGFAYARFMNHDYIGLPRVLKEHGYYCAVFHAFKRNFWHRVGAYKRFGFDRYDSMDDFEPGRNVGYGLGDEDFFLQVIEKLRQLRQPYMAFVISLSAHGPFDNRSVRSGISDGLNLTAPVIRYFDVMRYADSSLKVFWDNSADIRQNSIVAIFGDHQGFGQEKHYIDMGYKSAGQDLMHQVPLIISAPFMKNRLGPVHDVTADQADIAPTILYMLNIPAPPFFVGHNLFDGKTQAFSVATGSLIDGDIRYETTTGECLRSGAPADAGYCKDLVKKARALETIKSDLLWGNRYSYQTKLK